MSRAYDPVFELSSRAERGTLVFACTSCRFQAEPRSHGMTSERTLLCSGKIRCRETDYRYCLLS